MGPAAARSAEVDPFEKESEIAGLHFEAVRPTGTLVVDVELSALESLCQQAVAGSVPPQDLDPVPATVEEDEKVTGLRILIDVIDDHGRQSVKGLPKVGGAARNEDTNRRWETQHEATTWRRRRSSGSSNPART